MNDRNHYRLGTRGSPLALWQAERVRTILKEKHPCAEIEIAIVQTTGDKILDKPLVQIGDKGLFTKEIEKALQEGEIDFAVHSFKDLPTALPEGLAIVSIPERDSPFDALIAKEAVRLRDLPKNPAIATGSLRRRAQILAVRPDARVVDIRGNVNTRLRKYDESNWDALVMAEAGLRRMGWIDRIAGTLDIGEMLPAPAQGALAVEARRDDERTTLLLQTTHNPRIAAGVEAERAFLAALQGGCQVPIAAYAIIHGSELLLHGLLANLDGNPCIRETLSGPSSNPAAVGDSLANRILRQGGQEIIDNLTH